MDTENLIPANSNIKLVINILDMARLLEIEVVKEFGKHGTTVHIHPDVYYSIVAYGINDIVSTVANWSVKTNTMLEFLETLPWIANGDVASDSFYVIVDTFVVDRMQAIIHETLPIDTFDVWEVKDMGRGSILIESVGDYRIYEYYRMKKDYESRANGYGRY